MIAEQMLLPPAESILAVTYRGPVRLTLEEVFSTPKNYVVRCRVREASSGNSRGTVIVKRVKEEWSAGPYDPTTTDPANCSHALLNDWAAAAFLSHLPGRPPLGPKLYGGDRTAGMIVLEDLGAGVGPTTRD